ncbi:hypothetical protein CK507_04960 [Pseudomonas sp. WN033]|nr:hypothetical protein CK507_04960 [Pseudomonas sp. WN033]
MSAPIYNALVHPQPPPPVGWWPPAPGWWVIAGLLLLVLASLPWMVIIWRRQRQRRQLIQHRLASLPQGLNDRDWLAAINTLLKRLLKQQGFDAATRLHGQAWLDYLCQHPEVDRDALTPLGAGHYQRQPTLSSEQRQRLLRELARWMRRQHV